MRALAAEQVSKTIIGSLLEAWRSDSCGSTLSALLGVPLFRKSCGPFSCRKEFSSGSMEQCAAVC